MKKRTKVFSLVLALALVFALGSPAFALMPVERIVAFGDSVPAGYGLKDAATQCYPYLLKSELDKEKGGHQLINLAVSGYTSGDLLEQLKSLNTGELTELKNAKVVTLNIGGNNILHPMIELLMETAKSLNIDLTNASSQQQQQLMAAIGKLDLAAQPEFLAGIADFKRDFPKIIELIKTKAPEAKLVVNTVYNPIPQLLGGLYTAAESLLGEINKVIETAVDSGWLIADVHGAFAGKSAQYTNFNPTAAKPSIDIHPNAAGHKLIAQLVAEQVNPPWKNPYDDVAEGAWYYSDVQFVTENGLMNGSGTSFGVEDSLTRGMLVTVLYRYAGSPSVAGLTNPFSDVPKDAYYTNAVLWAANGKIVNGSDGKFNPDDKITREQLAVIFYRYAVSLGKGPVGTWMINLDFSDKDLISDYALEGISWCVLSRIIGGSDGYLSPKSTATRTQAAAMLHRFIVAIEGDAGINE